MEDKINPVSAQQGAAEQHNAVECYSALRAEPAGRVLSAVADLADEEIAEICVHVRPYHFTDKNGNLDHLRYDAAVARAICTELAARCRAEGGNTSDNESSNLAAKAPAAQAEPDGWMFGNSFYERGNRRVTDEIKRLGRPFYAAPSAGAATTSNDARDAARYRWLRKFPTNFATDVWGVYGAGLPLDKTFIDRSERLDAAIDSAMSAHQAKKTEGA